MEKIKRKHWIWLSILAVIGIMIFILNCLTPLCADDFTYTRSYATGEKLSSVWDIVLSQYAHYFSTNGRSVLHFLGQLFLYLGKPVFNVINTVAYIGLCVLILYVSFGRWSNTIPAWAVAVHIGLWMLTPGFGDSFFWLIGAANYLYGILLICLYLIPFRKASLAEGAQESVFWSRRQLLFGLGYLFAGLLAGWTNENTGPATCGMVVLFLVYYRLAGRRWRLWMFTGLAGNIVGALLVVLCPAQQNRLDYYGGSGTVREWIVKGIRICHTAWNYLFPLLLLWAALAAVFWWQNREKTWKEKLLRAGPSLILGCGAVASAAAMAVAPYFPLRVWSGIVVLSMVSVGMLAAEVDFSHILFRRISCALLAVLLADFAITYSSAFRDIRRTYQEDQQRTAYILSEKAKGNMDITIPSIKGSTKYSVFVAGGDLEDDPAHWRNAQIADYFGVDVIRKADEASQEE